MPLAHQYREISTLGKGYKSVMMLSGTSWGTRLRLENKLAMNWEHDENTLGTSCEHIENLSQTLWEIQISPLPSPQIRNETKPLGFHVT